MEGRTTFVIAHRLATIRNADRILVFDQGRIVETGSFDELVAKGGRFAELAKAQFMAGADKAAKAPREGEASARGLPKLLMLFAPPYAVRAPAASILQRGDAVADLAQHLEAEAVEGEDLAGVRDRPRLVDDEARRSWSPRRRAGPSPWRG